MFPLPVHAGNGAGQARGSIVGKGGSRWFTQFDLRVGVLKLRDEEHGRPTESIDYQMGLLGAPQALVDRHP